MRKTFLIAALACFGSLAGTAWADVVTMPATAETSGSTPVARVPARGMSMAEVEKQFGTPRTKHPAVGGGSRKQPPITKWDYDGFTVVFERSKVIDAIVAGAPVPVQKTDELTPAQPPSP